MMMKLEEVKLQLHNRFLRIRCIYRIILSDEFAKIYKFLSEFEIEYINKCIEKANKEDLERFIKKKIRESSKNEELPVVILRQKARELGIKRWQYLTKSELLSELDNVNVG